jgi:hypothetical protein
VNPTPGANTILVTNDLFDGGNELAVSAILLTGAAQTDSLGTTVVDVSTSDRTGESETVATTTSDLVVHVIADRLFTRGTLGDGETSRSVANDGGHIQDGDASLWISTKPGEPSSTTVSSTDWASSVINGVAIVVHGGGPAPPTISQIANQFTPVNTPTQPIAFTVGDPDAPASSLTVSGSSSNPTLVPDGNIIFGGSDSNRTVTVTPAGVQTGTATITITVSDGQLSASSSFVIIVGTLFTGTESFTNPAMIIIPSVGNATPYPSVINVFGMGGTVSTVTVTLSGLSHTWGGDIDVLLVGPDGKTLRVMENAGTGPTDNNADLTFSDAATDTLPESGQRRAR